MDLLQYYSQETPQEIFASTKIYTEFFALLKSDKITKADNPTDHIIVYFLPVDSKTKQVFLVYDKKVNLTLAPGGHLDPNETSREAAARETREKLGFTPKPEQVSKAFLVTKTKATNPNRACVNHYDIWYRIETNLEEFQIEEGDEFKQAKWMTVEEAKQLASDPATLTALKRVIF